MTESPFIRDFSAFRHFHFHYQAWSVSCRVHEALLGAVRDAGDERARNLLLDFWEGAIVEFHIYYVQPLLSATACNRATYRRIHGLDRKALTANGLSIEGVRNEDAPRCGLSERALSSISRVAWASARTAFGVKERVCSKVPPLPQSKRIAAWITSKAYFDSLCEALGPELLETTHFLTHQASLADAISSRPERLSVGLIRSEGSLDLRLAPLLKLLPSIREALAPLSYHCPEHGVTVEDGVLWDLWQNFLAVRWPAYRGFSHSAKSLVPGLANSGIRLFLLGQDRNFRERIWCRAFKACGVRPIMIEPSLLDPDAQWTFGLEVEKMLVDSKFTQKEMGRLGYSPEQVPVVGHFGINLLTERRPQEAERRALKSSHGFAPENPLVFYATQNFGDVSAGSSKKLHPLLVEIKEQELDHMIRMAERHGFHLVLKPHRDERAEFYRERVRPGAPITVLESSFSAQELLRFVDAVVTRWSTVAHEAMACGIPVYFLNFYHHTPQIACYLDPDLVRAREPETADGLFARFWADALTDEARERARKWAANEGWEPSANGRIRKEIRGLLED